VWSDNCSAAFALVRPPLAKSRTVNPHNSLAAAQQGGQQGRGPGLHVLLLHLLRRPGCQGVRGHCGASREPMRGHGCRCCLRSSCCICCLVLASVQTCSQRRRVKHTLSHTTLACCPAGHPDSCILSRLHVPLTAVQPSSLGERGGPGQQDSVMHRIQTSDPMSGWLPGSEPPSFLSPSALQCMYQKWATNSRLQHPTSCEHAAMPVSV
jgi:hypothetical protein